VKAELFGRTNYPSVIMSNKNPTVSVWDWTWASDGTDWRL